MIVANMTIIELIIICEPLRILPIMNTLHCIDLILYLEKGSITKSNEKK